MKVKLRFLIFVFLLGADQQKEVPHEVTSSIISTVEIAEFRLNVVKIGYFIFNTCLGVVNPRFVAGILLGIYHKKKTL